MKGSVLIIDDDPVWMTFSQSTLEAAGYAVETAKNTVEVWELFTRKAFDLILMDLKLVEEGHDVLQKIAKPSPDERRCVVVMFPTQLSPIKMLSVFKLGAYDCVDKPFDENGLIRVVKEILSNMEL